MTLYQLRSYIPKGKLNEKKLSDLKLRSYGKKAFFRFLSHILKALTNPCTQLSIFTIKNNVFKGKLNGNKLSDSKLRSYENKEFLDFILELFSQDLANSYQHD